MEVKLAFVVFRDDEAALLEVLNSAAKPRVGVAYSLDFRQWSAAVRQSL